MTLVSLNALEAVPAPLHRGSPDPEVFVGQRLEAQPFIPLRDMNHAIRPGVDAGMAGRWPAPMPADPAA